MPDEHPKHRLNQLCPAGFQWHQPPAPSSPGLAARGAVIDRWLSRTRAAAVRSHWKLAKRLSLSVKDRELKGWFQASFDENGLPSCPMKRLIWLIEVRDSHAFKAAPDKRLRINAAIWREITSIKGKKIPKIDRSNVM